VVAAVAEEAVVAAVAVDMADMVGGDVVIATMTA
jgi:hypothetical protein